MDGQRTEIASLGEFGLIDHLTQNNETVQAGTLLSVGDDAAVIDQFGRQTVITSDMLLEGVHFDLMYTPLKHLGYKAVAVNLSDICAMYATPTHITVNIGISNRFSVEALGEFYEGIYAACEKYHVDLIGGDTCSSQRGFVISVTAIGEVAPDKYVTRAGAKKGDLICVSGDLGAAYTGLQLLEREKRIFLESPGVQPSLQNRAYNVGRILKPEPRVDIVEWLRENEIVPTSMIDVSDGLSSELLHICRKSQMGCMLYEEKIPIHADTKEMALEFNIDPTTCALSGGEDYELLFTISQADHEKISGNSHISVIGYITEASEETFLVTKGGNKHKLTAQGWNAFDGEKN
ncbi:thiamine-phosphate kinase [Polluticoccus soli]|uniref:thiamine-phosphate kinase n=1 Tax=Polluticoccus soli TaxID=3034150 RepID=UPI0023E1D4DD|nr:thiamine-phosphate kinase [Flavipsychrobacter sp. JY13-12]